jgi:hypothetical protein
MHTIIADLNRPPRPDQSTTSPPNISTRAFIQWLPDPPSEPTSTEVLTSREKSFVDIRILKQANPNPNPTPSTPAPLSQELDWAFAGRSSTQQDPETNKTLARWHHTIDSRSPTHPESVIDRAEMLPEDPETRIALEKGSMVNPATGSETAYVEGWRETEVVTVAEPTRGEIVAFEREIERRGVRFVACDSEVEKTITVTRRRDDGGITPDAEGPHRFVKCWVLQHENAAGQSRGMVVRLGQFCQGVLRVGDGFAAERWEWTVDSGWRKVFGSGDLNMPCDVACFLAVEKLRAGSEVVYSSDETWRCVEEEQGDLVEEETE